MRRFCSSLLPVLVAGLVLFAGCDSGGGVPDDLGASTAVTSSAESDVVLGEGEGPYTFDLSISDPGFKDVPVDIAVDPSGGATLGEDILFPADTTIRFPESATSGNSRSIDIPIVDDESIEDNETAAFTLSIPDSVDAELSGTTSLALTIENDDFFEVFADAEGLTPSSGDTDAHCLVQRSNGEVVFFNSSDGGIFSYENGLTTERSASNLNSDISAETNTIDRCDGVAKDNNDNVYFLFRSSENSSGTDYVYKLPASGSPAVLGSEEGLSGVAHNNGTVYLAGVAFDGAPEDGFFSVNDTDEGQSLSTVVTGAVDLVRLDVDSNGNLYSFSGEFGGSGRNQKIVRVTDPSGSPTIEEFADPYGAGSPLVAGQGDNIGDIDIVNRNGEEFLVVFNGSFQATNGEQWASIRIADQSIDLLFNRSQLVSNTPAGDFVSGFTEPVAVNDDGEVFVASRAASFGGEYYLAKVADMLP